MSLVIALTLLILLTWYVETHQSPTPARDPKPGPWHAAHRPQQERPHA